ncbi:hypothetical protein GC194_07475 [bacterium]|nr:hypothetical protein [bacterium]
MNRSNCVRQIVLLSILFIALLSGSSCQRTPDVPQCSYDCTCGSPCPESNAFTYPYTDTLYQSDSFLSYWFFPVGSWWVYKRVDTMADIFDTAVVVKQDRGIACDCQMLGDKCIERASLHINHSAIFHHQNPGKNKAGVDLDTDFGINWVFADGGTDLLGTGGGPLITIPFTAAEDKGYSMYYEKKHLFRTSRYTFKNPVIYHYQNPRIPADSTIRKTNVLVKDVGWVYFYHRNFSEWELVDYHIAKP